MDLATAITAGPPDLADLRGAVRLVASDAPAAALGAVLVKELATRAPSIDLIFHPWHVGNETERLERGELGLVITVASASRASLRTEPLVTYPYIVAMRLGHPAASVETFDLVAVREVRLVIICQAQLARGPCFTSRKGMSGATPSVGIGTREFA